MHRMEENFFLFIPSLALSTYYLTLHTYMLRKSYIVHACTQVCMCEGMKRGFPGSGEEEEEAAEALIEICEVFPFFVLRKVLSFSSPIWPALQQQQRHSTYMA